MYKIAAAVTLLVFSLGIATADEFFAVISKVDGGKVTLTKFEKGKKGKGGTKGEETTLSATGDVKVTKGKFSFKEKKFEAGDAIEGGLKSDTFAKGNTVTGQVTTNDDGKITGISVSDVLKANEINARITKVDGSSITYVKVPFGFGGGGKKKTDDSAKEEELTVKATSSCKVVKGKFDADTKKFEFAAVEGGLKSDVFKEPVRARIILNDDKQATEVRIQGGFGGGKGGFKKKKSDTSN